MKKLILLMLLAGFIIQPLFSQAVVQTRYMAVTQVTPTQKCYYMVMDYKCPQGNCTLNIYKNGSYGNPVSSGSANHNWSSHSGTVCFQRNNGTYNSKINCKASYARDGCVVVVEGGG